MLTVETEIGDSKDEGRTLMGAYLTGLHTVGNVRQEVLKMSPKFLSWVVG